MILLIWIQKALDRPFCRTIKSDSDLWFRLLVRIFGSDSVFWFGIWFFGSDFWFGMVRFLVRVCVRFAFVVRVFGSGLGSGVVQTCDFWFVYF